MVKKFMYLVTSQGMTELHTLHADAYASAILEDEVGFPTSIYKMNGSLYRDLKREGGLLGISIVRFRDLSEKIK